MRKLTLAVLIDAENIAAGLYPHIRSEAARLGHISTLRLFGDFSGPHLVNWLKLAKSHALQTEMQVSGGKGKNSTDILMTIQAMDILHQNKVDGICLVSNDQDFAPLVNWLKNAHMQVFGFGTNTTSIALRTAYDQFFLLGKNAEPRPIKPVVKAIANMIAQEGENGWINLSQVAQLLNRDHSELARHFCGEGKFLTNIQSTGCFKVQKNGTTVKITVAKAS